MTSLTDYSLGDQDSSAANDRVLVRSVVRDPKAPCSELRQQWLNLNVQVSTRTVNMQLNKAGLKAPHRTFLTLIAYQCNSVQWAEERGPLSTGQTRAVFC